MSTSSKQVVFSIQSSIYGHGRGWCFSPNDFLAIGQPAAIRQTLARLQKNGLIRRISWGLYDYPREHPRQGLLPPDIRQVVEAITRNARIKVLPSGAMAANLLGLSNQVPAKVVYLTEGLSRKIRVGQQEIHFKKTTPKNMATADTYAGLVIQALKHVGQDHMGSEVLSRLLKCFRKEERQSLQKYGRYAPAWIQTMLHRLVEDSSHG